MTTRVIVDAHAGWPVKVVKRELNTDGSINNAREEVVPPNTTQEFYVHSGLEILVKEMPLA